MSSVSSRTRDNELGLILGLEAVPVTGNRDSAGEEEEMSQALGLQETSDTVPYTENLGEESGIEEIRPDLINAMKICHDQWPFDWSTADVPGSPGLSRLFRGLETECDTQIPLLTLEEGESADPMCLSNSELQKLSKESSNAATDDFDAFSSPQKKTLVAIKNKSAGVCPQYPWRDIDNVFCGFTASPLNEIYIFPPCQNDLHMDDTYTVDLWASLTAEMSELETKLAKLETQFQDDHPVIMRLMEDLAALYCRLETSRKAERIYRRLVDIYHRRGTVNVKALEASLGVVNSLMGQGEYARAQSLLPTLQLAISRLVQPVHDLAVSAMWTQGWIFYVFGHYEEAEMLYRQHLQVLLSLYGPRASQAIRIMVKLGGQISRRKPEEGAVLLRRAAWLCTQLPATDEKACRSMTEVANLLSIQGNFEESYDMATKTVERFTRSLGAQHTNVLSSLGQLASFMNRLGKFHESANLFRIVVANRSDDESDEIKLQDRYLLACVVEKYEDIDEAIVLYEKAVKLKIPEAGYWRYVFFSSVYCLGRCYESRGRYDDALQLYRQTIDRLRKSVDDHLEAANFNSPTVARLESCISHVEWTLRWEMDGDVTYLSSSEEEGSLDGSDSEYDSEEEGEWE